MMPAYIEELRDAYDRLARTARTDLGGLLMTQKFHHGDHVQIAEDLGSSMSHFQADTDAIVIGSYRDQYGCGGEDPYTLFIKDRGPTSWYDEEHLTLLEKNRGDLLKLWQEEREERNSRYSDLNWIFDSVNRLQMLSNPPHASIRGLAACLLITEDMLWGPNGEGITYWTRASAILTLAKPYIERSSKGDWLLYCNELMRKGRRQSNADMG